MKIFERNCLTFINIRNIVLSNDNTRPHSARIPMEKYWILPHPSYSQDLASRNFRLFRSLENAVNNKKALMFVENFLNSKPIKFYSRGINKLPDKCQEVIQNNGKYTIGLVYLGLWQINHGRLFNAKSSLYIYIKWIWFGFLWFYGRSTIVGYLMANNVYTSIYRICKHILLITFLNDAKLFLHLFNDFKFSHIPATI